MARVVSELAVPQPVARPTLAAVLPRNAGNVWGFIVAYSGGADCKLRRRQAVVNIC
jgi:hypothetical protein